MTTPISPSFNNGARYTSPRYTARLNYVYDNTNTAALTQIASRLHNNVPCKLHAEFSAGEFNLVRVLEFKNGLRWVARLRMPGVEGFEGDGDGTEAVGSPGNWWMEEDARGFMSEVVTMQYIRKYTSIPVPEVFAFDASAHNSIGFPYILMSYIDGMTAFDRATLAGQPMRVPASYFNHYVSQLSTIMNELASIRAPCIGSMYKVPDDGKLTAECIGPIAETQSGPWKDERAFYGEYPPSLMRTLFGDSEQAQAASGGEKTVRLFVEMFGANDPTDASEEETETNFGLVNLELGTHNVLVDESFNILSVIDWDSTFAAPRAVLHHFPWCIGADPGIPGGESCVFPPLEGQQEMTLEFCMALAEHSQTIHPSDQVIGKGSRKGLFSVEEFFTKEALAFRAIAFFRVRQSWVDEEWVKGLEWLRERTQEAIWKWYGVRGSS